MGKDFYNFKKIYIVIRYCLKQVWPGRHPNKSAEERGIKTHKTITETGDKVNKFNK